MADADTLKGVAAWVTTILVAGSLVISGIHYYNSRDAYDYCYDNLDNYATWEELKPLLREYLEDRKFSVNECNNVEAAYEVARTKAIRSQMLKDYDDAVK